MFKLLLFKIFFIVCHIPDNIPNGKLVSLTQKRKGFYLEGDVFSYTCNGGFIFHDGTSSDYIYKCLNNMSYNNTREPLCITS